MGISDWSSDVCSSDLGNDIKEKDRGNGKSCFMLFRFDNGRDGCNGRAAAYGRTHTNKRFEPGRNAQPFPQYISRYESHDDSDQGDPERLQARLGHLLDAQAKTQRNNGPLQYLLGGKLQARLEYRTQPSGIAYGNTQQYSKPQNT